MLIIYHTDKSLITLFLFIHGPSVIYAMYLNVYVSVLGENLSTFSCNPHFYHSPLFSLSLSFFTSILLLTSSVFWLAAHSWSQRVPVFIDAFSWRPLYKYSSTFTLSNQVNMPEISKAKPQDMLQMNKQELWRNKKNKEKKTSMTICGN